MRRVVQSPALETGLLRWVSALGRRKSAKGATSSPAWKMVTPLSLGFPQTVTSGMHEHQREAVVILRLVLGLGFQDGSFAHRAQVAASAADPELHGVIQRQHTGVDLLAYRTG
jgi:hypothetical protein